MLGESTEPVPESDPSLLEHRMVALLEHRMVEVLLLAIAWVLL
jgi:hypothetical protein